LQVKHQIAVFLLVYAATNGLGGSTKLSLFPGVGNPRNATASSVVCFFCEMLSCLLLQHDTVDRNAVWNLRSCIYIRSNQLEKILVTYLVMKRRFSATSHVLFLPGVTAFISPYS